MKIPDEFARDVARFPAAMRELIKAELAAGNEITELSGGFPAPPVGAYLKLARPVTTRPRETAGGIDFCDRNGSTHSGEFTEETRFFFILEPPHPPEPEPDMDAIRAGLLAKQQDPQTKKAARTRSDKTPKQRGADSMQAAPEAIAVQPRSRALAAFEKSMVIGRKPLPGISHDLSILKNASPDELVEIEELLISRGIRDWRDVEALAALGSPRAHVALNAARNSSDADVSAAVAKYAPEPTSAGERPSALARFEQSMVMDHEKWHDGIGYDIAILKNASPEELAQIEELLISRGIKDWRDVEALAALDSPRARVALKAALKSSDPTISTAVARHAPALISDDERTSSLVAALEVAESFGGLSQTLLEVESFHPPKVIEALLRGVLARSDGTPVHFAAMLMFLHGKAASAFDWAHRPFFLKFKTEDRATRENLFRELCGKIGVEPEKFLRE